MIISGVKGYAGGAAVAAELVEEADRFGVHVEVEFGEGDHEASGGFLDAAALPAWCSARNRSR
jgi:hypothetical protein